MPSLTPTESKSKQPSLGWHVGHYTKEDNIGTKCGPHRRVAAADPDNTQLARAKELLVTSSCKGQKAHNSVWLVGYCLSLLCLCWGEGKDYPCSGVLL